MLMLSISAILTLIPCCFAGTKGTDKDVKASVGIDVISCLCLKSFRLYGSHCFHKHWTTTAEISINMEALYHKEKTIWNEHRDTIDDSPEIIQEQSRLRKSTQEINIGMVFWPKRSFDGVHIIIGGRIRDRNDPDIIIGAGYSLKIFRKLYGCIAYNAGIIESRKAGKLSFDGIRAGLNYIF